ncbi:MAG: DUF4249 family protein [Calditrichaeota bacterium]|nr:DUF4249 family protein [Calditrichota bacterium]
MKLNPNTQFEHNGRTDMTPTFFRTLLLALTSILLLAGCDVGEDITYTEQYVVEGYLFATEPLSNIKLSRTVPFGTAYNFNDQAVNNAQVFVRLLDDNENVEREYAYQQVSPGVYRSPVQDPVLPARTYALEIRIPDGKDTILRSRTVVPDSFSITRATADTIVYAGNQLELTITTPSSPNNQNVYIFATESLDPRFENLTPFFQDIFDQIDENQTPEDTLTFLNDLRISSSPLINEEFYDYNPDGTLQIRLPWISVIFFGPNTISANAVDDNVFNYISTQTLQTDPSNLSPGEIPNVDDPIDGGVGLFGSYARVSKVIYVARPPQALP